MKLFSIECAPEPVVPQAGVERGVDDDLERATEDVGRALPCRPLTAGHIRQNRQSDAKEQVGGPPAMQSKDGFRVLTFARTLRFVQQASNIRKTSLCGGGGGGGFLEMSLGCDVAPPW